MPLIEWVMLCTPYKTGVMGAFGVGSLSGAQLSTRRRAFSVVMVESVVVMGVALVAVTAMLGRQDRTTILYSGLHACRDTRSWSEPCCQYSCLSCGKGVACFTLEVFCVNGDEILMLQLQCAAIGNVTR